ncbi:MAG: cytochrome P450 [Candidatus Cyclobacteriaceae bacterium M3_2C_046]
MRNIPKNNLPDSTLSLLKNGYNFIPKMRRRLDTEVFQTRLMGKKAIFISGPEASEIFYSNRFMRKKATPKRVKKSLFGQGGVHGLDGKAHEHRKAMFMSLMGPESLKLLMALLADYWEKYIKKWESMDQVVLFDEVEEILCQASCDWCGVPLKPEEVGQRSREFGQMVDSFGGLGPRHLKGKMARNSSENWIRGLINLVREKKLEVDKDSAIYQFAWHRDLDHELLDPQIATVELMNIIRPVVAIAYYIVFEALALHDYPEIRQQVKENKDQYQELFVKEVRRFYPFTPFIGAIVKEDFEWKDYLFKKGRLVILDIHGIDHHEGIWKDPGEFRPERFRTWQENPYNYIPQGGGDHYKGHRCAGEWLTIDVMKQAAQFLTQRMDYQVPVQDLSVNMSRMPTTPQSRFIMSQVTYNQPKTKVSSKAEATTKTNQ